MDEFPTSQLPRGEKVTIAWELSTGACRLLCLHEERPPGIHTLVVQENGQELERHVLEDDPQDCIASYDRRNRLETDLRTKYKDHLQLQLTRRGSAEADDAQ